MPDVLENATTETIADIANGIVCPVPLQQYNEVLIAHGGGGRLTQHLIQELLLPAFRNDMLETLHDGAVVQMNGARIAFSTDSYVIRPIFFPGGDIGELAINGTVNDLAMCGANPRYISVSLILEEGCPMEDLARIVQSMQRAAARAGVQVVTGDTKVVDRGKGDQIFINTTGIGTVEEGIVISPERAQIGDAVILNGSIADHGIAIMSVREGLEFESEIRSDTAPLNGAAIPTGKTLRLSAEWWKITVAL